MTRYLDSRNFPGASAEKEEEMSAGINRLLTEDAPDGIVPMLGRFGKALGDNLRRTEWDGIFAKLDLLFRCGKYAPLDGPMIGVTMAIRDSDYFRATAKMFGADRSSIANLELMATLWNANFGHTGLWMGKTFEPLTAATLEKKAGRSAAKAFDPATTRLGRNFFRDPEKPNVIQGLGMPVLTKAWRLLDRPVSPDTPGFDSVLLAENLKKERSIPYRKTGGYFIAQPGSSVTPEMNGKAVYQLNYRWSRLHPVYPMTRLIDELVQIDEGVYLGQLVMATKHYSLGQINLPIIKAPVELGESYNPDHPCGLARLFGAAAPDYGYQNNGFFLMIDTSRAKELYADNAFPHLRPRPGEIGYIELGYAGNDVSEASSAEPTTEAWRDNARLRIKFTTFCLEPSPRAGDGDIRTLRQEGESILQMLQRIQKEITAATAPDDSLQHFEKLNRLFRAGIAPKIVGGRFHGIGQGYNSRFGAAEQRQWYGSDDPCTGFDYYHGATLNLHCGIGDTMRENAAKLAEWDIFPPAVTALLSRGVTGPDLLNLVWAGIGRYIFPWGGKSFERISGRKLSMLLDESADLANRYPERVDELHSHPASWPHYDLVKKNAEGYWPDNGVYATHLAGGSWDSGMSAADRQWWEEEAASRWVFGNNLQDSRILPADQLFRTLDMNYHPPLPSIQQMADSGPSPFVRQGYMFLGTSGRESILPMNNGPDRKKQVFQFHYRFPMIGGPFPIGLCLDELVEIAEGLFLGQLIYATSLTEPFHSSTPAEKYRYQLFGYFLLLDNDWERHRRDIGLDVDTCG